MEAASDDRKPVHRLFEDVLPVLSVTAKAAKNIPARRTDVSAETWPAQLAGHGLIGACFDPPGPIRELRDLTEARTIAAQDRTREIHRSEKFVESTGIKLSATVSDLLGSTSRAMLDALIAGERDPQRLADMASGTMRRKTPDHTEALAGRFNDHHAFLCQMQPDRIDSLTMWVGQLTTRLEEAIEPLCSARDFLTIIQRPL